MTTIASIEMESTRGMDSGSRCKAVRMATAANARPNSPPARLSSRPSQYDSRMITLAPRPKSQPDGILAAPANGSHQQQPRDIDAGNQQNDRDGEEQGAQQRPTSATAYSRNGFTSP